MKGITMIQAKENMPWSNDGARHAQVEFHWPVPNVIPAAINAPTLDKISFYVVNQDRKSNSLIKGIKHPDPPRSPPVWKRFRKINSPGR
jgi:hypothetical protein